ncbi:MBL fold metallo-hydrolase [Fictibacillus nanhaiensis]|uniref:MBL fold metallo-hydrolase n=1 Tax=Fictibacillus nanhaiensis TaxID=742169 RepID=UPI002E20501E|nr:MBL fold metallo-hydrolase [Fictibacillus nanhaiensis]
MKVKALGVNGAFTQYYHNNFVFELGDRKLLVDAGTTLRYSLKASKYKETDITDVFITHLHSDHVGGLEEFAQRCKWVHNHKPNLWIRASMKEKFEEVVGKGLFTDGLTLDDYFNVYPVEVGYKNAFKIGDYLIELIVTDELHAQNMMSVGLRIDSPDNKNIIYTSDIAKHEQAAFYGLIDSETVALFHDVSMIKNPVHSYIEDVVDHYKNWISLDKIYAMHYQDDTNLFEATDKYGINFVEEGFYYEF